MITSKKRLSLDQLAGILKGGKTSKELIAEARRDISKLRKLR